MKRERCQERLKVARAKGERARVGERRGCLICRRSDGGFMTEEHVLPESMGNTEIVLPNGVVCDACNGGTLSDLDQALCEFFPLKMRRTMLGIRSKAGSVPVTHFQTGSLRSSGEADLFFEIDSAKDKKTIREKSRVGKQVELEFQAKGGRRTTPRYSSTITRALLKGAFECAWLDHGEMLLEPRFDHVRDAILGAPRDGFLLAGRKGDPEHGGTELTYKIEPDLHGHDRLWVLAKYYGLFLVTDSRLPTPVVEVPDEAALLVTFTKSDLGHAAA